MRIGVIGCYHETNTFAPGTTSLDSFHKEWYVGHDEFISAFAGTQTSMGGVLDAAPQAGFEAVPLFYTQTMPSSLVEDHAVEAIMQQIIQALESNMEPLDGLLLIMHGAMASQSLQDVEGEALRRIRDIFTKPIALTLDLHANISRQMVELADIIVGYDTYPHVDLYERAIEASHLLARLVRREIHPVRYLATTDILIAPTLMNTNMAPMKDLMERAFALEQDAAILNVTVAGGFAFADVHCAGFTIVVTADGDPGKAEACGRELAQWVQAHRSEFAPKLYSLETAYEEVMNKGEFPAVLIESSDNVGGGSPADATHILRFLMSKKERFLAVICDREAALQAAALGIGGRFEEFIGGKMDRRSGRSSLHGEPVAITGRVRALTDGRYRHQGPYQKGMWSFMGKSAVIELDDRQSVILLTEERVAPWDINHVRSVGIDPEEFDLIIVKAAVAWRTAFGEIARHAVEIDTPGCCSSNLSHFTYRNLPTTMQIISGG